MDIPQYPLQVPSFTPLYLLARPFPVLHNLLLLRRNLNVLLVIAVAVENKLHSAAKAATKTNLITIGKLINHVLRGCRSKVSPRLASNSGREARDHCAGIRQCHRNLQDF